MKNFPDYDNIKFLTKHFLTLVQSQSYFSHKFEIKCSLVSYIIISIIWYDGKCFRLEVIKQCHKNKMFVFDEDFVNAVRPKTGSNEDLVLTYFNSHASYSFW